MVWNATVNEVWDSSLGQGGWNLRFARDSNDWELDLIGALFNMLRDFKISQVEDSMVWKGGGQGTFGVRHAYNLLVTPNTLAFRLDEFGWTRSQLKLSFLLGRLCGEDPHLG
ncbi:hypothetical protein CK203_090251 [Vitis vinifera]|uniref:Uncharacterized protein n=1 Tax=Vitis vinifera TaxID=29760 RepID=A0A438CIU5_VITVI|nr:hypothetical protein CK203_090251 [Vitis vinifera]